MTVTNKRESALAYIKTNILPPINGTGNFANNLKKISREYYIPTELRDDEFPMVSIVDDDTTLYTPLTNEEYTVGADEQSILSGFPILLIGYTKRKHLGDHDDAGSLSTAMNNLTSDILIAMMKDTTLGDNVLSVALFSIAHSLIYMDNNIGVVIHKYILKYDFDPTGANPSI